MDAFGEVASAGSAAGNRARGADWFPSGFAVASGGRNPGSKRRRAAWSGVFFSRCPAPVGPEHGFGVRGCIAHRTDRTAGGWNSRSDATIRFVVGTRGSRRCRVVGGMGACASRLATRLHGVFHRAIAGIISPSSRWGSIRAGHRDTRRGGSMPQLARTRPFRLLSCGETTPASFSRRSVVGVASSAAQLQSCAAATAGNRNADW